VSGKGSGRVSVARLICVNPGLRTRLIYRTITPEVNPVEGSWANLKRDLGDLAARGIDQLAALVKTRLKKMQYATA
jgi:hypothetical protein